VVVMVQLKHGSGQTY